MAHADEFETSLYLHLVPERVRMDLAVEDNDRMGKHVSSDSTRNYPVRFNDYWGRWTQTGVHGDPTKATAEKGRILFEAAVTGLVDLVGELRPGPLPNDKICTNFLSKRTSAGELSLSVVSCQWSMVSGQLFACFS